MRDDSNGPEWKVRWPIVGMVHLAALPGAPGWRGGMASVLERAAEDARLLVDGGVDGVLVENYGDAPFHPARVPAATVAALALAVSAVRGVAAGRPIGVNVLRNDADAALAIAAATEASFIRVNVHTGAMLTDQGWIEGAAHDTLRTRRALGARVAVWADVLVKHALPLPGSNLTAVARDTWERGGADALIVSGTATGAPTDVERLRAVHDAVPDAPLWVGSGLDAESAPTLLPHATGAIVGSALQRGGRAGAGVERERVLRLMSVVQELRERAK